MGRWRRRRCERALCVIEASRHCQSESGATSFGLGAHAGHANASRSVTMRPPDGQSQHWHAIGTAFVRGSAVAAYSMTSLLLQTRSSRDARRVSVRSLFSVSATAALWSSLVSRCTVPQSEVHFHIYCWTTRGTSCGRVSYRHSTGNSYHGRQLTLNRFTS